MDEVNEWLLRLTDEAFEKRAWHGPNLRSSIRGLSAEAAAWRPAPGRHNVWEIVLHCAYWKHRVHGRVAPGRLERFPYPGRDWPEPPDERTPERWKAGIALLEEVHARLRDAVVSLAPSELRRPGPRQKRTRLEHLVGIASHDIYHAGQIRLLHRLREGAR